MNSNTSSANIRNQIPEDFFRRLRHFYKTNGGFATTRGNLKILFYTAFSSAKLLKRQDVTPYRVLKVGMVELLDTLYAEFENGTLTQLAMLPEDMDRDKQLLQELSMISFEGIISPWNYFPRYLTKGEFANPAGFFERFFGYRNVLDWKNFFEELFSSSLLHQSIIDFSGKIDNPIFIHDYSFKLLDITHIVLLRHSARKQ